MMDHEICICGHTYDEHFGRECSVVAGTRPWIKTDCPCKQFVICDLGLPIFEALQYLVSCAELKGQKFDPAMDQALALAVDLIRKAKGN
jgi:hypothetical protein